jgi:hypothetical protein
VDAQATGRCHSHMRMWVSDEIEQGAGLLLVWAQLQFGVLRRITVCASGVQFIPQLTRRAILRVIMCALCVQFVL